MKASDCPKFDTCNASLCPLSWAGEDCHIPGEEVCQYLLGTGKAGDIKITDEQRNAFTEISGQFAHQILEPIVAAPTWQRLPDEVQRRIYAKVFTSAHKMAAAQVFTGEERAAAIAQISAKVEQEMRPQ